MMTNLLLVLVINSCICSDKCVSSNTLGCNFEKSSGSCVEKYDYLIVGAGLYGGIFAERAKKAGKSVLVVDRRSHIAGNLYTEEVEGIHVHVYGPHVFHANDRKIWEYINQFADFNRFTTQTIANYHGELYSLPFNMYTFNKMWGVVTPEEAVARIEKERKSAGIAEPRNLEEQAISSVGKDIYEKLVKGYTEKQWGRSCKELPAFILKRLPVRFTYDNNYFDDLYQGVPTGGYTQIVSRMLEGVDVRLCVDYLQHREELNELAKKVVFTGQIDSFYDYQLGALEYRSLRFDTEVLNLPNFQGNAVVSYPDIETPWTRITEHKWFEFGKQPKAQAKTVISREYSSEWNPGVEPFYPVNDEKNTKIYEGYRRMADKEKKIFFGGRLGEYKYYDMDKLVESALNFAEKELNISSNSEFKKNTC